MRTNICICVRKVISNARMVWLVFNLTENVLSHLLLFFKAALQLLEFSFNSDHSCLNFPSGSLVRHCHVSTSVQIKILMEVTLVMVKLVIR